MLPRHANASGKMRRSRLLEICALLLAALCIAVAYKTYSVTKAKQAAAAESVMQEEL